MSNDFTLARVIEAISCVENACRTYDEGFIEMTTRLVSTILKEPSRVSEI